ncbi:hypothetical protein DBV15_11128 [Temnothorax longispinosus]|uniref:Uncharacterized protein n=1 Tax=Temnothorax longispinosus TaxID=300112 RepID=A0A4S2KGC3_9HYME|nr:hypothetical protein DBV15_11128 [Temnothorax longispinosus]
MQYTRQCPACMHVSARASGRARAPTSDQLCAEAVESHGGRRTREVENYDGYVRHGRTYLRHYRARCRGDSCGRKRTKWGERGGRDGLDSVAQLVRATLRASSSSSSSSSSSTSSSSLSSSVRGETLRESLTNFTLACYLRPSTPFNESAIYLDAVRERRVRGGGRRSKLLAVTPAPLDKTLQKHPTLVPLSFLIVLSSNTHVLHRNCDIPAAVLIASTDIFQ